MYLLLLLAAGLIPENGLLRGPDGTLFTSPVLKGFIGVLFIIAAVLGIVYGGITGKFKNDSDVVKGYGG